jgi:hypothetical protein
VRVDALCLAQTVQLLPIVIDDCREPKPGLFAVWVFPNRSGQERACLLVLSGLGSLDTLFKQ